MILTDHENDLRVLRSDPDGIANEASRETRAFSMGDLLQRDWELNWLSDNADVPDFWFLCCDDFELREYPAQEHLQGEVCESHSDAVSWTRTERL